MKYQVTVLILLFLPLSVYGQNEVHTEIISRGDGIHQPTIIKTYIEKNNQDIWYKWIGYIEEDSFKGKEYRGKQTVIVGKKGPQTICFYDKNNKLISEQKIYRENPDSNEPTKIEEFDGNKKLQDTIYYKLDKTGENHITEVKDENGKNINFIEGCPKQQK